MGQHRLPSHRGLPAVNRLVNISFLEPLTVSHRLYDTLLLKKKKRGGTVLHNQILIVAKKTNSEFTHVPRLSRQRPFFSNLVLSSERTHCMWLLSLFNLLYKTLPFCDFHDTDFLKSPGQLFFTC